MTLHTHLGAQRARSGRTVHAFDTLDGTDKHSGPDRNARDPLCARALAARSSCAALLSGHEDMHMPSQLHRFDKREAGDHLEARNAATPIASWHADESRRQWPMHYMTNAQPSLMTIHRAPALHHCARDVVTAAPWARSCLRGRTAAPERQAGLSFWPHPAITQPVWDGCNSLAVEEGQLEPPAPRKVP